MRKLAIIILSSLAVLVTLVTGCGRAPHYDARLTAADSLMRSVPDSALAIVQAVSLDNLTTDADRAYHDLLLTQARYRCYVTATSDSAINRALGYYRAHSGEREKLTRALLYKGAVMEELGHPDSAMIYYKHAEATAAHDDYFNLGFANLRMGALYGGHYEMDGKEIKKYEEALAYFIRSNDLEYQLRCLNCLGCLYRDAKPQEAESMLKKASDLALQLNDTSYFISNTHALLILYYYNQRYQDAHRLIQQLDEYPDSMLYYDLCFCMSNIYTKLNMIDSAEHFINLGIHNHFKDDALYRMYYLGSLAELSAARKDTLNYLRLDQESNRISDSLLFKKEKKIIIDAEEDYEMNKANMNLDRFSKRALALKIIILISLLALAVLALLYYRRGHRYDKLIKDLKQENQGKSIDLKALQHNINELRISDAGLKASLASHMDLMREIIEECYHAPNSTLTKNIKEIIRYQNENSGLWEKLYGYINTEYNQIIDEALHICPELNERDLTLLALSTLGYSCAQIAIIMGYNNASTIGGNRQRLAKKLQLDGTLMNFINEHKPKE